VKKTSRGYNQHSKDGYNFNFCDIVLSFGKADDLSKIEFGMNSKKSYLFPKNGEYFQMYAVPFDFVLLLLELESKGISSGFGKSFDNI